FTATLWPAPPQNQLDRGPPRPDFLAPMLFSGTADSKLVNDWTHHMLCQELRPNSTLIFDNAPFHKKQDLEAIAHQHGHHHLFLPPYSPDFNRIEPDFANLKKIRQSAPPNTPLFDIVKSYGN
ncbi:MAG: transposase, partial [Deltaproteobacteria bacterium]|nr:transposase [Deltaproteobacteria bacterium]